MLTVDLVRARVTAGTLTLTRLTAPSRKDAVRIAAELNALALAMVGEPRDALLEAFRTVDAPLRLEKVRDGLAKLLVDACTFEEETALDPAALRRALFTSAADARRVADHVGAFDRAGVVEQLATAHELSAGSFEDALFADLRGAHRLLHAPSLDAAAFVARYELALEQAVLLRAERVVVDVRCASAVAYRALFRRLKFLRLLCVVDSAPGGSYRLTIDGPASLLAGTTKYGLELALVLPLLREVRAYALTAVVRWGPTRERATFTLEGGDARGRGAISTDESALPEELDALVRTFRSRFDDYDVTPSDALVELRGEQVLVPDLCFRHRATGVEVWLELLGHHSRDALFRRVELAPRLPVPMVFAASSRLRVREEIMPDDLPACLYVFKGTLRAVAVHERLEALRGQRAPYRDGAPEPAVPQVSSDAPADVSSSALDPTADARPTGRSRRRAAGPKKV